MNTRAVPAIAPTSVPPFAMPSSTPAPLATPSPWRHAASLALAVLCAALCVTQAPVAWAADLAPLRAPRLDSPITIDGHVDEAVWTQAETVELAYETSPGDNTTPAATTTAYIATSDDALLLGFRAHDPDPARIRAFLRDRDALYNDDFLGVQLDTFDDQRRAYEFFVNPLGVQADLVKEEASGNEDDAWDGLWTSAARITADGYEVEMRIPFRTLRFANAAQARRWGVRFLRIRPREYRHVYSSHRIERGARCDLCAMGKLEGLEQARPGRNLEIAPTLTIAHAQTREAGRGWRSDAGTDIEPGLDVTWSPSPNLTFNGTLNPDFSQVESDEAQLDLNSNFALFFPEKRPFFLEGADYFNSPLNIIYTRQLADPDVGLRVTGRNGRHAYGVVAARDATTQVLSPRPDALGSGFVFLDQPADALLARYRFDVDSGLSVGAIATHRDGDDYRNSLIGIDARLQRGGHTLTGQWLRSDSIYPDRARSEDPTHRLFPDVSPAGNALVARYNFGNRHWSANINHTQISPGFRADLGFIGQIGYRKSVVGGGYTWYGAEGGRVTKMTFYSDWDITYRHDGQLLERELQFNFDLAGPRQSELSLVAETRVRYAAPLQGVGAGGLFDEHTLSVYGEVTLRPGVKGGMELRHGQQLDLRALRTGTIDSWEPWMQFDFGRGVNLNLSLDAQRLRRDGGTAFEALVFDGRFSWQLDPRQRLRLSVQGSDVRRDQDRYATAVAARRRDVAAQLLYSYKLNPRSALYAGYSHGAYSDDRQTDLTDSSRSLFLKLSYAWQP